MAYTTATIVGIDRDVNDLVTGVVIEFTGVDEPAKREIYRPAGLAPAQEVLAARQWRDSRIEAFNNIRDTSELPGLQVGQVIAAAPAPDAPSAEAVAAAAWRRKIDQYNTLAPMGTFPAGALATQVAQLKTDVNNEFNAANGATRAAMAAAL
jgi:hypothetical protein